MNIYKSILKVQTNELGKSLLIFWSIWLLIIIASYTMATLGNIEQFMFIGFVPVLVWIAVYSFKSVNSDLHYVLQLGASRKQLGTSAALLVAGLAVLMTLLHFLFSLFFTTLAANIDFIQPITLFSWAGVSDSLNLFQSLLLDTILSLLIGSIMVLSASLNIRFGKIPLYLAVAVILVALPVPFVHENLLEWVMHIHGGKIVLSLILFLLTGLACLFISNQLLRKATLR